MDKPQANLDEFQKDADGYITIFDGKTMKGWRGYGRDTVPGRWVVEDGCIKFNGSGGGEAQAGDVYSYVKINLETGRRTETKLDLGGTEAMAYGLRDDNGSISPFAITRHDGENYIEVF